LKEIKQIWTTLHADQGPREERIADFHRLIDQFGETDAPIRHHMSQVMQSFEEGLFVGSDELDLPTDNLDLERWIKAPKGHERRIHGRQHVGLRVVYEGPTLLPAVDAHLSQSIPFTVQELLPYATVDAPESQQKAVERHRIMTRASSKKNESPC
jgi:hypothetical protein